MSHGDTVEKLPPGFRLTGRTRNTRAAAIEDPKRDFYGVQFHPEVVHTKEGKKVLANFLFKIAGLIPDWDMGSFVERKAAEIRKTVGRGRVLCGLSGGVDSLVTALIIHRAVGKRLTCVFVDNGLLRGGQYDDLMEMFRTKLDLNVVGVDASERIRLTALRGVSDPEQKRKIIGGLFIKTFRREADRLGGAKFLAQGTIYPDVIESNPVKGPSAVIKSHHNVGGLPKSHGFTLVEPLRELFKDEVRALAAELGADRAFVSQHPFPGPGLAVRIVGPVDRGGPADRPGGRRHRRPGSPRGRRIRPALAGLRRPAARPFRRGDGRPAHLPEGRRHPAGPKRGRHDGRLVPGASSSLLARISTRIVNEVAGVNRVVFDVTSKPPGTIEWE